MKFDRKGILFRLEVFAVSILIGMGLVAANNRLVKLVEESRRYPITEYLDPVDYLKYLQTHWQKNVLLDEKRPSRITLNHVEKLMTYVDSTEPAAHPVSRFCCVGPGVSTVGDEAIDLVNAFREGVYPPSERAMPWKDMLGLMHEEDRIRLRQGEAERHHRLVVDVKQWWTKNHSPKRSESQVYVGLVLSLCLVTGSLILIRKKL